MTAVWEDIILSVAGSPSGHEGHEVLSVTPYYLARRAHTGPPWRGSKSLGTIQNHLKSPSSSDYFVLLWGFLRGVRVSLHCPPFFTHLPSSSSAVWKRNYNLNDEVRRHEAAGREGHRNLTQPRRKRCDRPEDRGTFVLFCAWFRTVLVNWDPEDSAMGLSFFVLC